MPHAAQQFISERQHLVHVALGHAPADRVITGACLLNTYSGEWLEDSAIAIVGDRLARIGDCTSSIGPETEVIHAPGLYAVPGFIDAHYHIESSLLSPRRHAEATLPLGLTSLFHGTHEITNVLGLEALAWLSACANALPQRLYLAVSSATPPSTFETTGGYIGADEFRQALPMVAGLGEVMDFPRLVDGDARLWGVIAAAKMAGQIVEGHGAYPPPQADAFAAAGISSSHSIRLGQDAIELLRRGCDIQLQCERARDVLQLLLKQGFRNWHRIGLCVDDRRVDTILDLGAIDHEIRVAIEMGVEVTTAYQMATINNAQHWHREDEIGAVVPGRYADILLISDLKKVTIEQVIAAGQSVARAGQLLHGLDAPEPPSGLLQSMHLAHQLRPADFRLSVDEAHGTVRVPVLQPGYRDQDVTPLLADLRVVDHELQRDLAHEINKVGIIERHRGTGNVSVGFWRLGFRRGAVAMSILHDSHNISVVGASDHEMALAVNRVAALGGGIVVVEEKSVLAEVPLPVGGLMSDQPLAEVAAAVRCVRDAVQTLAPGTLLGDDPLFRLTFIFLTCHPYTYTQTDQGVFATRTGEPLAIPVVKPGVPLGL
jgi:adenine deaminase